MNFPCAVSHDLARYERELDADYARDRFIENRTEEIKGELVDNVISAMSLHEYMFDDTRFDRAMAEIQLYHRTCKPEKLVEALNRLCSLYDEAAEKEAKSRAEREFEDGDEPDFDEPDREF